MHGSLDDPRIRLAVFDRLAAQVRAHGGGVLPRSLLAKGFNLSRGPRAAALLALFFLCVAVPLDALADDDIQTAGDLLQLALPLAASGLTLEYHDSKGTLQFGESAALTLGITYGLKYSINETRPNGGSHSFPSGHTSIAFSAAEFMAKRYGWKYGVPAYAAASFVAYSRVEADEHYTHDVFAGAAIGIASSYLLGTADKRVWIQEDVGDRGYGIRVYGSW